MIASPENLRQPADARHRVIAFGMSLAFLSYLDRACISQAAPMIARDLHFNAIQMGYIFSAFGLTYAAMEIPSGWLIDRYGPRLVLTRVVICWSFFTAATGFAWNFASRCSSPGCCSAPERPDASPDLPKRSVTGSPPRSEPVRRAGKLRARDGEQRRRHCWWSRFMGGGLASDFCAVRRDCLVWASLFISCCAPIEMRKGGSLPPGAMADFPSIPQRVGSLRPMVLSLLRLLLLRDLAADLFVAGARGLAEARSHPEWLAAADSRVWLPFSPDMRCRLSPAGAESSARAQSFRVHCLRRSQFVPAVSPLSTTRTRDDRDESVEFLVVELAAPCT